MKKLILIIGVLLFLFQCSEDDTSVRAAPAQGEAEKTDTLAAPADTSGALASELQKLGFILTNQKVKAPDFTLESLTGENRSLSSYQGQYVFLNFWGVWCVYCRQEMPSIQRMYDQLKDKGLEVVAVDVQDTEQTVRDYIKNNNHTFPVLLDTEFVATQTYGVRGFPTTFLVDREGYLVAKLVGSRDYASADVISTFTKLLSE